MSDITPTIETPPVAAPQPDALPAPVRRQRPTGQFIAHVMENAMAPRANGDAAVMAAAGQDSTDPNRRPSNVLATPRTGQQGELPPAPDPFAADAASPDQARLVGDAAVLADAPATDPYGGLTREEYIQRELGGADTPVTAPAPADATPAPAPAASTGDAIPPAIAAELAELKRFQQQYGNLIPVMDNLLQNGITSADALEQRMQADQQEAALRYQEDTADRQTLDAYRSDLVSRLALDDSEVDPLVKERQETLTLKRQMERDKRQSDRQYAAQQEQEAARRQTQEIQQRQQTVDQAVSQHATLKMRAPNAPNAPEMGFGEKFLRQYVANGNYTPEQIQELAANVAAEVDALAKHLRTAGASDAGQRIAVTQQSAPQPISVSSGGGAEVSGPRAHPRPTGTDFYRHLRRN